jgi:preprotein translocase subunit SecD
MNRSTRIQFIAIVLLTLAAVGIPLLLGFRVRPGIDLAGGAELRYKMLFETDFKGDRKQALQLAADVVRRRLEGRQLQEPRVTTKGDDEIVIQIAGIDAEGLNGIKRSIGGPGKLELHAAAPPSIQEQYDQDRVVPSGYKAVKNCDGSRLLIRETSVIEGRHIVHAEPQQDAASGGIRWVTLFELDAEGSRRFDEAAEQLYRQQGRIVILLDGEVRSAPVVRSPAFHGRGTISGLKD